MLSTCDALTFPPPGSISLQGLLGEALDANRRGRLSTFITDEASPAIALFAPEATATNDAGDWYGEHAGKWLIAATRAAVRAGDAAMLARVRRVADWLVGAQAADGYLGNYPPHRRFTRPQPPRPLSWNGEPAQRTWDIWTHSYLVLGLVELHRATGEAQYRDAACRIVDLIHRTLEAGTTLITELGNHWGLSATVLLDPVLELHAVTADARHLALARLIVDQIEAEPRNRLFSQALAGVDPSDIATGKAYQLLWNLVGFAKLARETGDPRYLEAVETQWRAIRAHHLTLGGGPWGGVAHRSREVFNAPGAFDPHAYVETCSTMAWIQLNRALLGITGNPAYAEEIERSAYNDLLGAQGADGEDWCYYSFPNGRRVHTTYWRCCKSSGAIALEELPGVAMAATADGIVINLLGPAEARLETPAGPVTVRIVTSYPLDGRILMRVESGAAGPLAVLLRIPSWAHGAICKVGGASTAVVPGTYARIVRHWHGGDDIELLLPMVPRLVHAERRNVQESVAPDGETVQQEVMRHGFVAIARGPLAYATGLIDGYRLGETVRPAGVALTESGDVVLLHSEGRAPIPFEPYYRAGGRMDGAWRLTWLNAAVDTEPA